MSFDDYGDYPMGDEKSYQNRKKYGSSVHPNSSAAKMHKRLNGNAKSKAIHTKISKKK